MTLHNDGYLAVRLNKYEIIMHHFSNNWDKE